MATLDEALELLRGQRWAALATLDDAGAPAASQVAYALDPERPALLLHLSRLAAHTRHLQARPRAALSVTRPDTGAGDPQQLPRLALRGRVVLLERASDRYRRAREHYLARLPHAEPLFEFPDFLLFRLAVEEARFVGGFARASDLDPQRLATAWRV